MDEEEEEAEVCLSLFLVSLVVVVDNSASPFASRSCGGLRSWSVFLLRRFLLRLVMVLLLQAEKLVANMELKSGSRSLPERPFRMEIFDNVG